MLKPTELDNQASFTGHIADSKTGLTGACFEDGRSFRYTEEFKLGAVEQVAK